jgi:phospholipase D1/2
MHDATLHNAPSILDPGKTCWKLGRATQATLLVDGEEYFAALRRAMLQARKQILIAGWDFDSRIRLPRGAHESGAHESARAAPEELGEFLGFLLRARPELEIHVVRWDYHWFYRDDREAQTRARLERLGVHFHDDDCHPVTGCVHHKVVVIDNALAFCGGIDLTHKRWDTCRHLPRDERRVDCDGHAYIPVHDTQLCVSGPIARALADYLRANWPATGAAPKCIDVMEDLWPENVRIEFRDVAVGIARTLPPTAMRPAVREIERFYLAAIANTQRTLYVENQYFTSTRIARALAERCRAQPEITGLLVGMDRPKSPAEVHTMGYGRSAFLKLLTDAGVLERIPLVAALSDEVGVNMHSKLATFDDRWLTVGSANLNHRSMGFDVECNLIIEASTPEHCAQIERIRTRLLAEHMGMSSEEALEAIRIHGLPSFPDLPPRARRLKRVDPQALDASLGPILAPIFDPEKPWTNLPMPSSRVRAPRSVAWAVLLGAVVAAALTGQYVRHEMSSITSVQQLIESFSRG